MPPRIGMQRFLFGKLQNDCSFFEIEQIAKLCSVGEKTMPPFFLRKRVIGYSKWIFSLVLEF